MKGATPWGPRMSSAMQEEAEADTLHDRGQFETRHSSSQPDLGGRNCAASAATIVHDDQPRDDLRSRSPSAVNMRLM